MINWVDKSHTNYANAIEALRTSIINTRSLLIAKTQFWEVNMDTKGWPPNHINVCTRVAMHHLLLSPVTRPTFQYTNDRILFLRLQLNASTPNRAFDLIGHQVLEEGTAKEFFEMANELHHEFALQLQASFNRKCNEYNKWLLYPWDNSIDKDICEEYELI